MQLGDEGRAFVVVALECGGDVEVVVEVTGEKDVPKRIEDDRVTFLVVARRTESLAPTVRLGTIR